MTRLNRRGFIRTALAQSVAVSAGPLLLNCGLKAAQPFNRSRTPRLRLGLAAYSFREFFPGGKGSKTGPNKREINMFDFVDYCAEQNCDGAEVTSYYFPKDADSSYFLRLKHHAFIRGIALSGTAVGNTFTPPPGPKKDKEVASVKQWIDHSATMGAPHIRVFAGNAEGQSLQASKSNCIAALEECADYAAKKGVFLGIENHGGIVSECDDLLDIVKAVKSQWVGINLDTGNFHTADPYADIARCVPYAVNVQLKADIAPKGQKAVPADISRLIKILRDGAYQGYVALEYESAEDPWTAVPRILNQMREAIGKSA